MTKKPIISGLLMISLFLIILNACNTRGPQIPEWLEGTWTTEDTIGLAAESWEKINSTYMSGEGLFITADGRSVIEVLNIFIQDGILYYTALVPNQNEGLEIIFMDNHLNPDSLVFKNPKHDYPKQIVYHKIDKEMINVYLFGDNKKADKVISLKKADE